MTYSVYEKKDQDRRKPGPLDYSTPRDSLILKYIWKWKLASSESVHVSVNKTQSPYSTYKVLDKLERRGLVASNANWNERFHVWTLTEKGFYSIRNCFGELKEEGFGSENQVHDRLVQAFHLGEWATYQFPIVSLFSEQEMRRIEPELYPSWVPRAGDHRPDGYTQILGKNKSWTLAFEVELHAKSLQRYDSLLRYYRILKGVDQVFWLVGSDAIKNQILKAKDNIGDSSSNYHVFVDKDHFEKFGWDSVVTNERSENLFTLRENYQEICGDTYGEIMGKSLAREGVTAHLSPTKVIGKSRR